MRKSRKRYRIRKKKTIFKSKLFRFAILIALLFGLGFWLTLFSPLFQIQLILISGNETISSSEIEKLIYPEIENQILLLKTKSIFVLNTNKVKDKIQTNYPVIDELRVKKLFPNSVAITIEERKRFALWRGQNSCFFIDKKGIVFEQADQDEQADLIIFSEQPQTEIGLNSNAIAPKTLDQIIKIKQEIEAKTDLRIQDFTLFESEARLNVKTTEGWQIYFYLEGDLDWKLIELELILDKQLPLDKRQDLEYIDLRYSKAYYQ